MKAVIAVFTDTVSLYQTVKKSIRNQQITTLRYNFSQYKTVDPKAIQMVILDLVGEPDRYETMMRIFHLKCHLKRPILVLTDNENSRFLLNIFTFGVEDYIKIWLDETILKSKVDKILRFQHWLNLYSVKNITKYIYLYFRKIITFIVDFYLYIDYNEFIEY